MREEIVTLSVSSTSNGSSASRYADLNIRLAKYLGSLNIVVIPSAARNLFSSI
jgi:hypothetical protein